MIGSPKQVAYAQAILDGLREWANATLAAEPPAVDPKDASSIKAGLVFGLRQKEARDISAFLAVLDAVEAGHFEAAEAAYEKVHRGYLAETLARAIDESGDIDAGAIIDGLKEAFYRLTKGGNDNA